MNKLTVEHEKVLDALEQAYANSKRKGKWSTISDIQKYYEDTTIKKLRELANKEKVVELETGSGKLLKIFKPKEAGGAGASGAKSISINGREMVCYEVPPYTPPGYPPPYNPPYQPPYTPSRDYPTTPSSDTYPTTSGGTVPSEATAKMTSESIDKFVSSMIMGGMPTGTKGVTTPIIPKFPITPGAI